MYQYQVRYYHWASKTSFEEGRNSVTGMMVHFPGKDCLLPVARELNFPRFMPTGLIWARINRVAEASKCDDYVVSPFD